MKQVRDNNNGRKCLYFVDDDTNAELTRKLLNGISHSLKDDPTTVDWVVGEMKKNHCEDFVGDWDDEPTTSMMSKDSEDGRYTMYWNDYGEIEIWGNENISDSRKIKDENTPDVLDGVLFIAFTDGTEDDMIAEVNKHANESDTIDGVQYETYETDSSDGVAMIDMCAATGDANAFVKALLNKWGIAENVADLEFEASDEMKEAVNDSRKQVRDNMDDDYEPPFAVYEDGVFAERFDTEKEAVEYAKHLDFKYEHETEIFVVDESEGVVDDIVWSSEWVSDSRVNDMTKPVHLRGYAEKMRAKRRNKNEEIENEPENEKQDVADSRRVNDSANDTILHFHIGRGGRFYNSGHLTYEGVCYGLTNYAIQSNEAYGDEGEELTDANGNSLGAVYGDEVGILEWDGDYDTDKFIYLNEVEFDDSYYGAIVRANYVEPEVAEYVSKLIIDDIVHNYSLNDLPTANDDDYEDQMDYHAEGFYHDYGVDNIDIKNLILNFLDETANK